MSEQDDGSFLPHQILAGMIAQFTACADDGAALKSLDLCSSTFTMGPPENARDLSALRGVLEMRQAATYATRHSVGTPVVTFASAQKIEGRAIVSAFRLVDGKLSMNIVDFVVTIIATAEGWKLDRLQLQPFAGQAFA